MLATYTPKPEILPPTGTARWLDRSAFFLLKSGAAVSLSIRYATGYAVRYSVRRVEDSASRLIGYDLTPAGASEAIYVDVSFGPSWRDWDCSRGFKLTKPLWAALKAVGL